MLPIATLPTFIEQILPRFSPIFNKSQLRHFGEYLTGLVVSPNKTVAGINELFLNHTDQSSKNHFLTQANWEEEKVTHERLELVKEHCHKHHTKDGLLVMTTPVLINQGKKWKLPIGFGIIPNQVMLLVVN